MGGLLTELPPVNETPGADELVRPLTEEDASDGWAEPEKDGAPEALGLSTGDAEDDADATPEEEAPGIPDAGTDAALPDCSLAEDGIPEGWSEPEPVDATGALTLSLGPADAGALELLTSPPRLPLVAVNGGRED